MIARLALNMGAGYAKCTTMMCASNASLADCITAPLTPLTTNPTKMDIPTNEDIANELVSQALDEMDVERIVKAARDGSGSMSLVYLAEVIARSLDTESLDYFINQLGAEALSKTNDETRTDDNIGGRIEVGSDEVR